MFTADTLTEVNCHWESSRCHLAPGKKLDSQALARLDIAHFANLSAFAI